MRLALVIPVLALALNGQTPGYVISTVAGSGWIGDGGPATRFAIPPRLLHVVLLSLDLYSSSVPGFCPATSLVS